MLLQSQVVFVSGAADGHGREYARGIVNEGGIVVANDIDDAKLCSLKDELGEHCVLVPGDIGEADKLIAEAIKRVGRLDAVINNAAAHQGIQLLEMNVDSFDRIVRTNLRGPFLACQAAIRYWQENGLEGRIVNISSRTGLWPNPGQTAYAATKAGIAALTIGIATEFDRSGIVINAVCPRAWSSFRKRPASIKVNQHDDWDPVNLVAPVLYLASAHASWCNGQVFAADGDVLQLMHGWASGSAIRKGSAWQTSEMHEAFRRLTGVFTQMSDDGKNPYQAVSGIAARGRPDWHIRPILDSSGERQDISGERH